MCLGCATCLFHACQSKLTFAMLYIYQPATTLRTLPTAATAHHPRSTRKGVILSQRQASPKCRPSPQFRRLRLQMLSVVSKHDQIGISPPQDHALRSVLQDRLCPPAACQTVVQLSSPVAIYGRDQDARLLDVQLPPPDEAALQSFIGSGNAGS